MAACSANESAVKAEKPSAPSPAVRKQATKEEIRENARKQLDQPVPYSDSGVWGVLTAVCHLSRKRPQGVNIMLTADEHCFGRCVEDSCYRINSNSVSAKHCVIFQERAAAVGESESNISVPVFIKDTSTNGTFLNWTKLEHSAKVMLQHGDIISFSHPPHHVNAYAFVYREVSKSESLSNGTVLKRKPEDLGAENKRLKGIGIGAPEGPISLDDVRSLQRSNKVLRQQLESQVHTIESMRSETRALNAWHENELKDVREEASNSYIGQIKDLRQTLDNKQKEIDEHNSSLAELRRFLDDLKERLRLSNQSRADADEIIHSQKTTISELEAQLSEERNLRINERAEAEADKKAAIQRAQTEAQEEIKRHADVYLRQHQEQQEVISKLQESEKDSRVLVETLRSKLGDVRERLAVSEEKVRQLEVQVQDEQAACGNSKRRSDSLESEVRRLTKELESEKVAREEAWAKVSSLELEIAAAIRDLSIEKQRFQGARERIILRETQLRAFYSTTEEISALFTKQQEQLKSMQKTLEDEENYANTLMSTDLNEPAKEAISAAYAKVRDDAHPRNNTEEASGASTPKNIESARESSDDGSTTEKHDCDLGNQEENTQELECTSPERLAKGFVCEIDGVGTAVVADGDPTDTEHVPGTESQFGEAVDESRMAVLHKCSSLLAGETMQLDDDVQVQENEHATTELEDGVARCSQSKMEDTEVGAIRTADLLTSEVAGSWAVNTAPSINGENESPRSPGDPSQHGPHVDASGGDADVDGAATSLPCSDGLAAGSQSNNPGTTIKLSNEHRALNAMIKIVSPDFRQQFLATDNEGSESMSDAETDNSGDASDNDEAGSGSSEDGNEAMIEDSVS